jgi:hypothetical protein
MNIDQQLDARQSRRLAANGRTETRLMRREAKAQEMVGELSNGKCYVFPVGGKYREGNRAELVTFLIRNNYA